MGTTIGAENLESRYGGPLGVARALLEGRIDSHEQRYVSEVIDKTMLEAARIQLELETANCFRSDLSALEKEVERAKASEEEAWAKRRLYFRERNEEDKKRIAELEEELKRWYDKLEGTDGLLAEQTARADRLAAGLQRAAQQANHIFDVDCYTTEGNPDCPKCTLDALLAPTIPERIVVSPEQYNELIERIENPRGPTPALVELMKDKKNED